MILYSTNWMGPLNRQWIIKHGGHWSAGRIDIYDSEDDYPQEMALPAMHSDDWRRFSGWLDTIKTAKVWDLDRLVAEYEKTNPPIRWHKEKKP
jgi:hypothetical protein